MSRCSWTGQMRRGQENSCSEEEDVEEAPQNQKLIQYLWLNALLVQRMNSIYYDKVGSKHQPTIQHSWHRQEAAPAAAQKMWDSGFRVKSPAARTVKSSPVPPELVWQPSGLLKRGDNLISTHVNTTARARRKLRDYCACVTSSCSLWPQEWKIFKWLWCPGSCWTAPMAGKHLSPGFPGRSPLLCFFPQQVNDGKLFVCTGTPWLLRAFFFFCGVLCYLYTASNSDTIPSLK